MRLSEEDRDLLAGRYGEVAREAMKYQGEVGRYYGAEEMVSITQASTGMDFALGGEYNLEKAEDFAARGGKFRCYTKTGFVVMDLYRWNDFDSPPDVVALQWRLHDAYVEMGATPTYSNLPYLMPQFGANVAWTGNHIMANAFFGARTNLEGPIGSLMAGLAGRVPKVGLRLPENRRGTTLVRVQARPRQATDWDALGYAVGKRLPEAHHVPVFAELPAIETMGLRQRFDSNIAVPSSLQMYHIVGRTPEARTLEDAFHGGQPEAEITVTEADMDAVYDELGGVDDRVELVAFAGQGHHVDMDEFPELVGRLEGKKVADGVRLWVFTGPQYKPIIEALRYDEVIERAGGRLIYGTSLMLMTPRHFVGKYGLRNVVTDSAKAAKYARGFGMQATFHSIDACIEAATTGFPGRPKRSIS